MFDLYSPKSHVIYSTVNTYGFTGLLSGMISSLLFFWILSMMQPKITISEKICKYADEQGIFYGFKILNNSIYDVLDLKVELILNTPVNSHGGSNHSCEWVQLKKDCLLHFSRYRKEDSGASYALVLGTRDNLEAIWNQNPNTWKLKFTLNTL